MFRIRSRVTLVSNIVYNTSILSLPNGEKNNALKKENVTAVVVRVFWNPQLKSWSRVVWLAVLQTSLSHLAWNQKNTNKQLQG